MRLKAKTSSLFVIRCKKGKLLSSLWKREVGRDFKKLIPSSKVQ